MNDADLRLQQKSIMFKQSTRCAYFKAHMHSLGPMNHTLISRETDEHCVFLPTFPLRHPSPPSARLR